MISDLYNYRCNGPPAHIIPQFHTSRWDYSYTGGSSLGDLNKLGDKRVAIIGTGATAVQVTPHLGLAAKELLVFQRTPSSIDIRNQRPTDERLTRVTLRARTQPSIVRSAHSCTHA